MEKIFTFKNERGAQPVFAVQIGDTVYVDRKFRSTNLVDELPKNIRMIAVSQEHLDELEWSIASGGTMV